MVSENIAIQPHNRPAKAEPASPTTGACKVWVGEDLIGELPAALIEINKSIDDARFMLELVEDWDDEGGMPVDKGTFTRAIRFLINYSAWLLEHQGVCIAPPQIHPGPNGSVDISWRTQNYRMLINIPSDSEKQAGYYGDDKNDGDSIKGKVPTEGIKEFLALWLKNLKA